MILFDRFKEDFRFACFKNDMRTREEDAHKRRNEKKIRLIQSFSDRVLKHILFRGYLIPLK